MNIIVFGTGPFAVPTFRALLQSTHQVMALVTRPIEDAGNRRKTAANPMRDLAMEQGIPILDPQDVNAPESIAALRRFQAELFMVCDYGQILSDECLKAARLGGINLHGSILPKFRGAAPINWAIYRGEESTGISVIHMTSLLDAGPILATAELPIAPDDTTPDLEPKLSELGIAAVMKSIEILGRWDGVSPLGKRQDPSQSSNARRLRKEDGQLIWTRSAKRLALQVRAFKPWPGSFTSWTRLGTVEPIRLIIDQVQALPADESHSGTLSFSPGQVCFVDQRNLWVQTGNGKLAILSIQPAGKKTMPIEAFLRGYPITLSEQLG